MLFFTRFYVADTDRLFVYKRGRLLTILGPGAHTLYHAPGALTSETHSVLTLQFAGPLADFLVKERPALAAGHFTVVETSDTQVAMVFIDGKLTRVVGPASRVLFWKGIRTVTAEVIDFREAPEVPVQHRLALGRLGPASLAVFQTIEYNRVGLLYLDSEFVRLLSPGYHVYWAARSPRIETMDLRRQTLEVPGQEILTKDKVTLRVNLIADYRVTDPVKAGTAVKGYTDHLYRQLQLAIRATLGKRTLDELLADKVDVDADAASAVRAEMAAVGVEVGAIALKDIILPGEIREILNQVVAAEKQAQANLIRRREETAATRSLLNTAKLMEGNPILIRLKELEAIERLTGKVEHVTVKGGLGSLLAP